MDGLTGQVLGGRYRVDQFLGRGGMANVYRVWDLQRATPLAAKVLRAELAGDAHFLHHFEREAQALSVLQHPNIVRFYGLEESNGQAFLLMDYIDGLSLRQEIALHRGGMEPARVLQVMQPLCAALFYAHRVGLIHCDIKPANVMVQRGGGVFLTDFGIARMSEASPGRPPDDAGTPAYMAPEQLAGCDPTPAVDAYALGVLLFEMLTGGRHPYLGDQASDAAGGTTQKIAWEKHRLPPPPLELVAPDAPASTVSAEMDMVIARCLQPDPRKRYANTLDLLYALEAAVCGRSEDDVLTRIDLEAPARKISPPRFLRGLLQRGHRRGAQTAVAGGLVLAIGLAALAAAALGTAALSGASRPAQMPAQPAATAMMQAGFFAPGEGSEAAAGQFTTASAATAPAAVLSPTATATRTPPPTGVTLSAVQAATTLPPAPQPTPLGGARWLAFASDRNKEVQIWVMDAQHPSNHRQITNAPGGACQPAWSPDGQQLAYTTPCSGPSLYFVNGKIEIIDLASREVRHLGLPKNSFDPAWSPDEKTLLFTALILNKPVVRTLNLETMETRTLTDRGSKDWRAVWSRSGEHVAFLTSDTTAADALWVMDRSGGSLQVINDTAAFLDPQFSPDGRLMIATRRGMDGAPYLVLLDRFDPTRPVRRLLESAIPQNQGSFSPDGRWIVFWSDPGRSGQGEIMLARADGSEVRQLTTNNTRDFHPAWQPEGSALEE
jgi:Tol biopolymer transport system component/predicted Ser/Thr protein kinase